MNWFFLALVFAIYTSISAIVIKNLTKSVSLVSLTLTLNLFIVPCLFILVQISGGIPQVSGNFYLLMAISALLDTLAFLAVAYALKISSISLLAPLSAFTPVFTTIIAALFLGEAFSSLKFMGVLIVVLGAYLLNFTDIKGGLLLPFKKLASDKGVQYYFAAHFLWALTPIFQKKAILLTSPQMPLYPSLVGFSMITLFVGLIAWRKKEKILPVIKGHYRWFIFIGIFAALAHMAAYTAFSLTNVGYVTAVFRLSALFSIILGALFFKEEKIRERLVGAVVMILGTILLLV